MFGLDPLEIVVIGAIAVMFYGKRLPEVGRTVGRTVADLRKQWSALAREFDLAAHVDGRAPVGAGSSRRGGPTASHDGDDVRLVAGPRFEPPEGES